MSLLDRKELQDIKAEAAAETAAKAPPKYEYASVANCGTNTPDSTNPDDLCTAAALYCAGNTAEQGLGPSVRLFRRAIAPTGRATGPWVQYGITCFPEDAPGARPTVTMAMVIAAFHDTAFAKPTLEVQPKGNVTLVTLPTYFETRWPRAGFEPGEIDQVDPARTAGFRVEIRPKAKTITYAYGDGTSSGPTTSLGGPYPEGDITKAYPRTGDFTVRADATYTGQFRVNGGEWIDIPGDVTIQGTPEALHVKTAKARLVTH
ncbi:hypothetical protein [Pedococcus bigeumensis]|nr:hypothetical protein [Pedococcus bigeumensis]